MDIQTDLNNDAQSIHRETRSNVKKVAEIEAAHLAERTTGERAAAAITAVCGSTWFVLAHVVWFGSWLTLNSIFDFFDPFPFTFLTLVVSLEAIFLSMFLLISQNQETRLTERRNHLDLQINLLAEQENTKMLELLRGIAVKLGVPCDDPETNALLEPIEPGTLAEQIVDATGKIRNGEGNLIELP